MISCSSCRKSFVYAEVRNTDTPLEVIARRDLERWGGGKKTDPREVGAWLNFMTQALRHLDVGTTVAYLDGHYFPISANPVAFVGDYALHDLPILPHSEALNCPERLSEILGDPDYWIERKRPEIVIVAGPNGAGKTTFANAYLPLERERFVYINADEIARDLRDRDPNLQLLDMQAARQMLARIDQTVSSKLPMMLKRPWPQERTLIRSLFGVTWDTSSNFSTYACPARSTQSSGCSAASRWAATMYP